MSRRLKVAIYQVDGEEPTLVSALQDIEGLRVVGQWDGSCDLIPTTKQTRPDVLAVLLNGSSAEQLLEEMISLAKEQPNLAIIGVGLPNDPALLRNAMRAKLSELLDLPVEPERLLEALEGVMQQQAERASGRLIAVCGTGGGCGATTIAANLAVELTKRGSSPVVVVDLDIRRGQIATMFDVSPSFTLAELSQQSEEYDERVFNSGLAKHDSGVLILARPRDPEESPVSLVKVSAILNGLLEYYDWVIVDGMAHSNMTTRIVQDLADDMLLVTQPVVTSVRNATQIVSTLSTAFNQDRLHVVVNRVPKKLGVITLEKISEILKRPVYSKIPEDPEAVNGAINVGIPLAQHAAGSKARLAIRAMAAQLAGARSDSGTESSSGSVVGWLKERLRKPKAEI